MDENLPILIVLLGALALATLVAPRLRISSPVLLAMVGVGVGLVPSMRIPLDPDLVLVAFLPPLLYADAFQTSWTDFRRWMRPILMLAVGLVAATIVAVGFVAHWLLPLPWAACFLLGAIVSPTDTVAVQAVIERLHVPRRITAILGGESLINDATGLVGVQMGIAVALSGTVAAGEITLAFLRIAGGGIAVGIATGVLFAWANRVVRDTKVLFVLSLLSPYLALLVARQLGVSGVLAVVIAGFVVAWRIHSVTSEARVQLYAAWDLFVFVLNGLCFLLIGVETPRLIAETQLTKSSELITAGLAISAAVILLRILWTFPGAYLPHALFPRLRDREGGTPTWRGVAVVSWCGMRGVVSLAAALSLPLMLDNGRPFIGRELVIACTLCVILTTLFVQGLTLEPLIRFLGLRADEDGAAEVRAAREKLLEAGVARLDEFCSQTSCPLSVHHLRELLADELTALKDADSEARRSAQVRLSVSQEVRREVRLAMEKALMELRESGRINDKTFLDLQLALDRDSIAQASREGQATVPSAS